VSAVRVTRLTFGYPAALRGLPGSGPVARTRGAGRCGFMASGGPQPAWRGSRSHSSRLPACQRADPTAARVDLLGYDRTYISMIECGRRTVTDRGTLTRIAQALAIPPHMLGIVGPDDADFAAMLAFGSSVIRLADIARHSGRAADAVSELWPLITRLEPASPPGMPKLRRCGCWPRPRVLRGRARASAARGTAGYRRPVDRPGTAYRMEPWRSGAAGVRAANARQRTP